MFDDILPIPIHKLACPQPNLVVQGPIPFSTTCEHHVLPFFGHAWVGYIPSVTEDGNESVQKVYGLSKLTRFVNAACHGLNTQERVTNTIAQAITGSSKESPRSVAVVTQAEHMCMACRGVAVKGVHSVVTSFTGAFSDDSSTRSEFMSTVDRLRP